MASNGNSVHENSAVRYDNTPSDAVHVEVQSPAKNRAQGRTVGRGGRRRTLVLFERASAGSWWNPKFDSHRLEKEVLHYYFPITRRRFQYALVYIILATVAWAVFFGSMRLTSKWFAFLIGPLVLGAVTGGILLFTRFAVYERFVMHTSLLLSFLLCGLLLASFASEESDISLIGTFAGSMEILLLFYTFIPMPLYVCAPLGILYSVAYECLVVYRFDAMKDAEFVLSKVLLHLSLHLLGIHIFIVTQVRYRSNFWKVVQCVMARRDLAAEQLNLENMIHSLMPKSVADQVMTSRTDKDKDGDLGDGRKKRSKSKRVKGEIIFRSFNMNQMEKVSILFADIVGFTKMSSNKTAEHLVGLLNDLFGRFDKLCTEANCEKISTLGDCYYCVAGCPEPQPDHAECCVKMGLGMIIAIKEFDEDNQESVNMRVGVHTGTVLCGIVGTRRFKFDVWSNDVTIANIMESTGKPGMVHISEASYDLLKDKYEVEQGEDVEDLRSFKRLIEHYDLSQSSFTIRHEQEQRVIKTYFITGIKPGALGADGPSSNAIIISFDIPEKVEGQKGETSGSAAAPANHTPQENSVNGMSRATHLPGKRSSGIVEGTENDKLEEKVPTGEEGRGASSELASPVHVQEVQTRTPVPVPSVACSVPVSVITTTTNIHLPPSVTSAQRTESCSPTSVPQARAVQAFTHPIPATKQHFKNNVVAISMVKRSDDQMDSTTVPFNRTLSMEKLHRNQMDQEMIDHLNKDSDLMEFSSKLPINNLTLFFTRSRLERDYRSHYFDSQEESIMASPRCQSFIEMILSLILFLLIAVCSFVVFDVSVAFVVVFCLCLLLEVLVLLGLWTDIRWGYLKRIWLRDEEDELPRNVAWWNVHNFVGIVIATLPAVTVYANLSCDVVQNNGWQDLFLCFCLFVSLLCYCNFSMACSMVKSFVASLFGLALLILLNVSLCDLSGSVVGAAGNLPVVLNATVSPLATTLTSALSTTTTPPPAPLSLLPTRLFSGENTLRFEIILDVLLILLLIWFLNREFEISYRLSFYGSAQADKDTRSMQENKEQADWLLHNIIPVHVSDVVKRTHKYSKNHKDVGVIFATIINFNEFYDEGFEGGREYLRVLNELVSDYEELLDRKCFKDVEKIKTISSTFMAASGLNEVSRNSNKHPNAHLFALMDFSVELQNAVIRFNENILNFNFVLNIGYNFGEVTAGVIGTTKLLFDIWGDTVNIASRMYSTGAPDRIQVPESTLDKLNEMFEFEYRGDIFVKGKGKMNTYLYTSKRPDAQWE